MPRIDKIITNSNYQLIRTRIGEILVDELTHQYYLTDDEIYNCPAFIGRSVPFDVSEMPCLNLVVPNGLFDNQNPGYREGNYTFYIDIYTKSKTRGGNRSDKLAEDRLLTLLNACVYILDDPQYKTLGFEAGFIVNKTVQRFIIADPNNQGDANSSMMGRLEITVKASEVNSLIEPSLIAGFDTTWKISETDKGYRLGQSNTPSAPIELVATSNPNRITLNWVDNNTTETGFEVFRSQSLETGYTLIGTTAADVFTFDDDEAEVSIAYFYKVRALDNALVSGFSNIVVGISIIIDVPSVIEAADFTIEANITAAVSNTTLIPNVTDKVEPILSQRTLLFADVAAYITRIVGVNATANAALYTWAEKISRIPNIRKKMLNALIYPCYPDSQTQGTKHFYDRSVTLIDSQASSVDLGVLNTPQYSAEFGLQGNGVDSAYWIPIMPTYWPMNKAKVTCYRYVTRLSTIGDFPITEGYLVSGSNLTYWYNDRFACGGYIFTSAEGYQQRVGGVLVQYQAEPEDWDSLQGTGSCRLWTGSDYVTPDVEEENTVYWGNVFANSSNRLYFIGAYNNTADSSSSAPTSPPIYSNYGLGMFVVMEAIQNDVDAKIFAEACDELQAAFGRATP